MSRKHRMRRFSVTIPAGIGQFADVKSGGSLLVIQEASAPFEREFDEWGRIDIEAGFTEDTGEDEFRNVRIYNKSDSAALTVSGYVGTGSGRAGIFYDYLRSRPTKLRTSLVTFAGAAISFPGVATNAAGYSAYGIPAGARRRQIVISNRAGEADVTITHSNGQSLKVLAAGDDYTLETDADLKLEGTATDLCNVVEIFYV